VKRIILKNSSIKLITFNLKLCIEYLSAISKGPEAKALIKSPRTMGDPVTYKKESLALNGQTTANNNNGEKLTEDSLHTRILIESNLCHEVGMTVLNILSLFIGHYKV
jgi:hypothetical protein